MKIKRRLVSIRRFCDGFITILILFNAIVAGLLTNIEIREEYGHILNLICDISALIFIIEMIVRIIWDKTIFWKGRYWRWNAFDLIITILSSISLFFANNTLITLRIFREFRVLRVFSRFRNLRTILDALVDSFSKLLWTGVFFIVMYYLYAVIGVDFFGQDYPDMFGDLGKALFTLFQLMTLDDWNTITKAVLKHFPYSWIYFISFILIVSYILLNFIVGIIISSLGQMIDRESNETINHIHQDIMDIKSFIQIERRKQEDSGMQKENVHE